MFFVGNPTGSGSLSVLQNQKIKKIKVQALPTTVVYHQCPKNRSVENAKKTKPEPKRYSLVSQQDPNGKSACWAEFERARKVNRRSNHSTRLKSSWVDVWHFSVDGRGMGGWVIRRRVE